MASRTYFETFDNGHAGWLGWKAGGGGPLKLDIIHGAMVARSPWGVDFNHAPPGAGYLHLLYVLMTGQTDIPRFVDLVGPNRFIADSYPRDFTNAKFTFRLRGDVDLKGSKLVLLAQADEPVPGVRSNHVLSGQPIRVTKEWSEQSITLVPDDRQWTPMGVRKVGADCATYGNCSIVPALKNVNVDLIVCLFPLDIAPAPGTPPLSAGLHDLRAGKDYPVDTSRLPSGEIHLDSVRIEWP